VPLGSEGVVIVGTVWIVIERVLGIESALALSFTVTVNEYVPAAVGVPPITPLEEFNVSPGANAPLLTVQLRYGGVPPLALNACEYATPATPLGSEDVLIVGKV
jgi:hypothetical protein